MSNSSAALASSHIPLPAPASPPRPAAGVPAVPPHCLAAFDLDGTITRCELLPRIARLAGVEDEMRTLTRRTLSGELDFAASFRKRFAMLRHLPAELIRQTVAETPLDPFIEAFILSRREQCVIVTGNLDIWVAPLLRRLGCRYFASRGREHNDASELLSVLDKADAAKALAREGLPFIAIGESVNDVPLFLRAEFGIAFAGVHAPASPIRKLAAFEVLDGKTLCDLLATILDAPERLRSTPLPDCAQKEQLPTRAGT